MVPKVIHYCWFGGNKKNRLIKKCIKSWKKFCPEYQMIEWNENNFDINCCEYVKKAYESKKWAYVSDYARFFVLEKYGGVYLDTDVQLLKSIDNLIQHSKFAGFADDNIVNTGLIIASEKNDWLCKKILDTYIGEQFENTTPDKILAIGRRVTELLKKEGLVCNGELQIIKDYTIYPKFYFNPTNGDMRVKVDDRAYSIHHYAATWFPTPLKIRNNIRRFIGREKLKNYYKIKKIILGK